MKFLNTKVRKKNQKSGRIWGGAFPGKGYGGDRNVLDCDKHVYNQSLFVKIVQNCKICAFQSI